MFLTFPHGRLGIGLLLVRMAVCLDCFYSAWQFFASPASSSWFASVWPVASLLLAVLLFLGLLTPLAGALLAVLQIVEIWQMPQVGAGFGTPASLPFMACALVSVGISLLGPGAYSVDALLFDRREIIIPHRTPRAGE